MPVDETEIDRPGKVFVGGLASDVTEDDLKAKFSKYGRLTEALVIRDKGRKKSRGFGFVTFENPVDGEDAAKELDGKELRGKTIHVEQATKPKPGRPERHQSLRDNNSSTQTRRMRAPRPGGPTRGGGSFRSRGGSSGMDRRGGGRGGPRGGRGGGYGGASRDGGGDRMQKRDSYGADRSYDRPLLGSAPRRGPTSSYDPPLQRRGDSDRYGNGSSGFDRMDRGMDRGLDRGMDRGLDRGGMDRGLDRGMDRGMDRGPPRSRDTYPSPTRDYGRSSSTLDSRMPPSRGGSSRDYMSSSTRDYSPPSQRDYLSRDSYNSFDRAPAPRDRMISSPRDRLPSRDYSLQTSRDYGGSSATSRSSFGGLGRDPLLLEPRDDFSSSRDTFSRDPGPRDYTSSRDFGASRGPPARSEYDRGPPSREYDSYRDNGAPQSRPSAPMSRGFGSAGSGGRDSGPARPSSSRAGPYDSTSRGPPARGPPSRGPPSRAQPPSRGPPPARGPPPRGPPGGGRGSQSGSRPPFREDRGREGVSVGSRRPHPSDNRGPPAKRPRPGGPPRGGGPPFRK